MREEIRTRLTELPPSIRDNELKLLTKKDLLAEITLKKSIFEAKVMDALSREIDPDTQKPKYSNEMKRKLALDTRLGNDDSFKLMDKELFDLKKEIEIATIELEYQKRQFRAATALAEMER